MVRETRHLWVSNLPKDAHEDTIREHFKRYGRVQSVRIIADGGSPIGSYDGAASTTDACQVSSSTHQHQQQSVVSSSTNPSSSNILLNNINHHHNNNNNNKDPTATGTGGSPKIASTDDGASTTPSSASSGGIGGDIVCICATVSFMDIKSASKAHQAEHKLEDRILQTEYYEPSSVGVVVGGQMLTMMKSSSCSSNNNSTNSSNCTSNVLAASATSSSGNTQSSGTQSTGPLQYSSNVPGTSRFLSNHGSSDDHSPGYERTSFYDRSGGRLSESETSQYSTSVLPTSIRRPNSYHVNDIRGRPRDRHSYGRNGSYATSIVDRSNPISHHRISSNAWYENSSSSTSRTAVYGNVASAVVQPDSTYAADLLETAGPTVNSVTKASSQGSGSGCSTSNHNHSNNNHHHHHHHRKKSSSSSVKKSRSSGSGSPVGSTSSRSRSHSRASSCSSTNSTSSNESGVGGRSASPGSRNLASAVLTAPANSSCGSSQAGGSTHADDNRPLAIRVRNLPARSSDTSLKDGLFHEYKKHGKVTWVKVVGSNHDRYALVCFKKAEDAEKALELSQDKLFFGCKIDVELYQSYDLDDPDFRAYEAELDEYHPKATRTLFIGNLEKDISSTELRKYFDCFGEIIDIDIKKQGVSAYAFCQYADIVSVVKAMRKMDGEHLGNNRIKLGFGKSMPTNCVWIDGISDSVSEHHLANQFRPFGSVQATSIDRERKQALVTFEASQTAQTAVKEMRGVAIRGRRIQIDFASRECQQAFYDKLEKRGERAGSVDASATVTVPGSRYNSCSSSSSGNSSSNNCNNNRYNATQENSSSASSSRSRAASFSRPSNPLSGAASPSSNSTGGGATPRTAGLRSRLVRYSTVPSTNSTTDYNNYEDGGGNGTAGDRRFRSYDEYSQGSSASHEDLYDHDRYEFLGVRGSSVSGEATDSPHSRLAAPPGDTNCSESKSGNRAVDESSCSSSSNRRPRCDKSPGDIKHLQKERYHLLEQLGEYPSSGDEISPKKRKYVIDHSSSATSNDHHHPHHSSSALAAAQAQPHENHHNSQRSIELRRLSEASLKQHTAAHSMHNNNNSSTNHRRPSTDSLSRHNSDAYSLLKRRKTEEHHHPSSGRGSRLHSVHSHEASGGESADGSRPGTPLCDEPNEPRAARLPRSVEPMYLPLPKFAEAMFRSRMNSLTPAQSALFHVSSLPPTLSSLTAPVAPAHATPASSVTASSLSRSISAPTSSMVPPAPVPETIPTSPPVRPPSHSSNTSDSEAEVNANAGLSESIKERLKSFEERFEKWAEGSAHNRRHSEQFQTSFRSKFLDLDLKEQSDIAKYMLEKKSIFDEDSKRLENIGDKYEPRDFTVYQPRAPPPAVPSAIPKPAPPATPAPNLNQLHQQRLGSGSPQVMSSPPPYSSPTSGTSTPVIKPLQYPFPSHPPAAKTVAPPASSPEIKNKMATLATPKPPAASSPSRVLMKSASLPSANVAEKATEDETKHRDRRKSTVDSSDSKAGDSEKESREKPEQPPLPSEDPQQKESERREAEERRRETEEQKRREELEATRRREIEEAKRREDELAKQQEEQRRKELEEARRKEEELKRREEEKRREAEQKRREAAEAEVKRREAEAEAKRQEAETKRREEDLKRREEESKRRAAERRETERREFDEAVKRREEEKLKAQEVQENKEKQREVKPEEEDYKTQKRRLSSPESMEDKKLKLEEKHRRSSKDNGKPKHRDERRSSDKMEFKHKQRSRPKENCVTKDKENSQENSMDKSFFDAIELRSSEDDERLRGRRESADKDDKEGGSSRKGRSKSSRRTMPNTSEDSDESGDNSKKHSIFDIPDDGPYVSMYDKVKARSCKNMQKQEEEKKIKAKFSKLKRSRAKREGKKRSTSWDEDSETDDDEPGRYPRQNKLASSSEDEPRRSGMYDSDEAHKFRQRLNDICDAESSETSLVNHQKPRRKISSRKNSRSARIASSDSSEDESKTKLKHELKLEMISDEEDFKSEPKKDDLKVVKSEFKTEKYSSEGSDAMKTPISAPAMLETKSACTFEQLFGHESSKKKHKKNKKRQKSFPLDSTDEDGLPLIERRDSKSALEEELKAAESRKKHGSSKKEKRREKQQREEERERKKIRKQKKPGEKHGENKMENIFGPLSDDDTRHSMDNKLNFDQLLAKTEAENRRNEESIKEESRKRKEKKRRDKRHRDEENSVDLDEAGRALEAQLMMSDTDGAKANSETSKADDVFRFSDGEGDNSAGEGLEKREAGDSHRKEKKKKKKRSKEEKHKHHHHGSSKDATAEPSPSLPCLLDEPKAPTRGNGMTSPLPITSSPIKKEKKADIFIPVINAYSSTGFGGQIDDKIHEKAVLSIAQELETLKEEPDVTDAKSDPKAEPAKTEEKSRVVISVEETDNAVAALLGESFGTSTYDDIYDSVEEPQPSDDLPDQDDEEMKKAIQSLNTEELDLKPETPQSEHGLQIDTDDDEPTEPKTSVFDDPPKTPDVDMSQIKDAPASETKQEPLKPSSLASGSVNFAKSGPNVKQITVVQRPAIGSNATPLTKTLSIPITKFVPASKPLQTTPQVAKPASSPPANTSKFVMQPPTIKIPETFSGSGAAAASPPARSGVIKGGRGLLSPPHLPAASTPNAAPTTPKPPPPTQKPAVSFSQQPPLKSPAPVNNHTPLQMMRMPGSAPAPPVPTSRTPVPVGKPGPFPAKPAETQPMFGSPPQQPTTSHVPYQPLTRPHAAVPPPQPPVPATSAFARPPIPTSAPPVSQTFVPQQPPAPADSSKKELSEFDKLKSSDFDKLKSVQQKQGQPEEKEPEPKREEPKEEVPPKAPEPPQEPKGEEYWAAEDNSVIKKVEDEKPPVETKPEEPKAASEEPKEEEESDPKNGKPARRRKNTESEKTEDEGVTTRTTRKTAQAAPVPTPAAATPKRTPASRKKVALSSDKPSDIYEFHDDSSDETGNKVKTKQMPAPASPKPQVPPTPVVAAPVEKPAPGVAPAPADDFTHPSANTRKSLRLRQQEQDGRSTVDDIIEDVVRNSAVSPKPQTPPHPSQRGNRRLRQVPVPPVDPRKAPPPPSPVRQVKRSKDRKTSESMDSSDEMPKKETTAEEEAPAAPVAEEKLPPAPATPLPAPATPLPSPATVLQPVAPPAAPTPVVIMNPTPNPPPPVVTQKIIEQAIPKPKPPSPPQLQHPAPNVVTRTPTPTSRAVNTPPMQHIVITSHTPVQPPIPPSSQQSPIVHQQMIHPMVQPGPVTPQKVAHQKPPLRHDLTLPSQSTIVKIAGPPVNLQENLVQAHKQPPKIIQSPVVQIQQTQLPAGTVMTKHTLPPPSQNSQQGNLVINIPPGSGPSSSQQQQSPRVPYVTKQSVQIVSKPVPPPEMRGQGQQMIIHSSKVHVPPQGYTTVLQSGSKIIHQQGQPATTKHYQVQQVQLPSGVPPHLQVPSAHGPMKSPTPPQTTIVTQQKMPHKTEFQLPAHITQQIHVSTLVKPPTHGHGPPQQGATVHIQGPVQHVISSVPKTGPPKVQQVMTQGPTQQPPPPVQGKVIGLHQNPQILTGAVASPPLKHSHVQSQQPNITGASSSRVTSASISPQGQVPPRGHQLQGSLPIEASLGDGNFIRGIPREYYFMYQTRNQEAMGANARIPAHLPRSPMLPGTAESNINEVDESMVASPPLELRRPPSGSLITSVPLSHQSPGDRATDSPYIHGARVPHYPPEHAIRFYENAPGARQMVPEPPPAHRGNYVNPQATPPSSNLVHLREREAREREERERMVAAAMQGKIATQHGHRGVEISIGAGAVYQQGSASSQLSPPQHRRIMGGPGPMQIAGHPASNNIPSHGSLVPAMPGQGRSIQVATPPHASQVPPQADSLLSLLQRYPVMWQGLLALKNDQAAVQMHFVYGNRQVAQDSLPCNSDGSTPPLRIAQRMRLEPAQIDGVARKMQIENEHCMLLALPCGRDHMDVLQQSNNLTSGFITYLQQKQAAGIVNIAAPGSQQAAYVVHIFPSCDFANDNLNRIAPDLLHRVADIAHLLIVIATV